MSGLTPITVTLLVPSAVAGRLIDDTCAWWERLPLLHEALQAREVELVKAELKPDLVMIGVTL